MQSVHDLGFRAQHAVLQNGAADRELFEYVFGGDNTLLALSFVLNIALAGITILAIAYLGRHLTAPRSKAIATALMLISIVSISSYTGLTSGLTLGVVEMPPGHPAAGATTAGQDGVLTMWGRYLTWTFSTPFILIALGMIAGSDWTKILTACAFTIAMCVTGLAAALTTSSLVLRWWWFALSTIFFLVIVYIILVDWTAEASATGTADLFRTLKLLTVVGWFGYPILWALGVEGFAVLDVTVTSWGYSILDVITKYVVTGVAMLYVVDEPDAITGEADYGTSMSGFDPGDD
ncbi:capsular biosynthesis protein CpsH [Natrinema saccharevitans]|uniref:Capsular biosynthesis protein CpsH n=1 Tax=Natrinema saccharevitans TaxID=301967 RepID=A0A1S8ARX1_9EURY|nr:bacteriorhodopsin [Natrinema saccharevitans]OLZ39563.1 capsular biosynthesis protein CpsH [Natrinema saccharevitans]